MAVHTGTSAVADRPRFRRDSFANTCSPEDTAKAQRRVQDAIAVAAGRGLFVYNLWNFIHHVMMTTDVDTMAIGRFADGEVVVMINPEFTLSLGRDETTLEDVLFVLRHEASHAVFAHIEDDKEKFADKVRTLAYEVCINAVLLQRGSGGLNGMPVARRTTKTGQVVVEPTGVDPRKVHEDYVTKCTEAGLDPVPYDVFIRDEHTCYTELKRLPDPPNAEPGQGNGNSCGHENAPGAPGAGDGMEPGDDPLEEAVGDALQQAMTEARRGSKSHKQELLDLAGLSEEGNEKAKKMWGDLGIMGLRGKTDATRHVPGWLQWLNTELASKLSPGEKLIFPKKRSGMVLSLGADPIPVRRGEEFELRAAVFVDRSASMSSQTTENINRMMGRIPGVEVDWYDFDGTVARHELGGDVHGGGGTNFQNCVDVVEGRIQVDGEDAPEYDCVVMVTDGYAPPVRPADPDRWIWLITEGGDDWPDHSDPQMSCHIIDTGEEAAAV